MLPSIVLTVALFTSLSAAVPSSVNPHHVPLVRRTARRRSSVADVGHFATAAENLKWKYGYKKKDPHAKSRRATTANVQITNQGGDTSYFASVSVGTPAQNFDMVLDTGSSDLWFATSGCATCPGGTPELNTAKSSSFSNLNQPITLRYGSGEAAGTLVQDTVTMGPFTITDQVFVAVDNISSGLINGELAGIMGLAFQGIASSKATPFWEAVLNANKFTSPELSFFITRFVNDPNAQEEEPGGVLTLGGTNSTFFQGNIDFQPFPNGASTASFWLQEVSGVNVNGKSVSIAGGSDALAAIDTGTTLIGAPTDAVNAIWGAVPGSQALSGNMQGFFAFPCNAQLNISISFGGPSWPISISDLNLGTTTNGLCLGGIFDVTQGTNVQPGSGTPSWIVGDTFLKNVYSVFRANPASVGFAQLSNAAGGSSGTPGQAPAGVSSGAPVSSGASSSSSSARPSAVVGAGSVALAASLGVAVLAGARLLGAGWW